VYFGRRLNVLDLLDDDGYAVLPGVLSRREADALARDLSSGTLQRSRAGARHLLSGWSRGTRIPRYPSSSDAK
jgi:hypothetical protein